MKLSNLIIAVLLLAGCGGDNRDTPKSPKPDEKAKSGTPSTEDQAQNEQEPSEESQANDELSVYVNWQKGPVVGEENNVTIAIFKGTTLVAKPENFSFKPWMTIHNHGAAVKYMKVEPQVNGSFNISSFYFTMSGPWDLIIKARIDGKEHEFKLPVKVP